MALINVTCDVTDRKELEESVDTDIKGFDVFFQSLGNDPLNGPERAIVKTYLWFKLKDESYRVLLQPSTPEYPAAAR